MPADSRRQYRSRLTVARVGILVVLVLSAGGTLASADEPYQIDDPLIKAPKKVSGNAPPYPHKAKEECVEGSVQLEVVVGTDGFVTQVDVIDKGSFDMGDFAEEWIWEWRFEPATLKSTGEPVAVRVPFTFKFEDPCPPVPEGTLRAGIDVSAPKKKKTMPPEYTAVARNSCIEGVVILEAIIGTDGRVQDVKILKGLPGGLDAAAKEAVEQWVFEPSLHNGEPVSVLYELTVNFDIDGVCERPRPLEIKPVSTPLPEVGDLVGELTVILSIGRKGQVTDIEVVSVTERKLLKPVRKVLFDWRFEPPVNPDSGKRVNATTTVSLKFPITN